MICWLGKAHNNAIVCIVIDDDNNQYSTVYWGARKNTCSLSYSGRYGFSTSQLLHATVVDQPEDQLPTSKISKRNLLA